MPGPISGVTGGKSANPDGGGEAPGIAGVAPYDNEAPVGATR